MAPAFPLPPVIFFDAVGTLLHPEPAAPEVYASIGRRFGTRLDGTTIAARFRVAFRRQEEADYADGLHTDEKREFERWRAIVAEVLDDVSDGEACFQELYAHFARPDAWYCLPEIAEVMQTLTARGHVLGIASNFDHRLRGLVENLPTLRSIHHIVVSSEIGWRKPASAFFAEIARRTDAPVERILYVGDDPINDYEGAQTAGIRAVLLDASSRLSSLGENHIRSLKELTLR